MEYQVFGLVPFFYYLDNILLHVLNAWLVFILAGLLLRARKRGAVPEAAASQACWIAWWAALVFAVHPLHWEAVGNISGRAILLCAAFVLGAFILWLRFLEDKKAGWLWLSAGCFSLGLVCKESAAMLIVAAALYLVISRRREWASLAAFAGVLVIYLVWRRHLGLTQVFPWRNDQELFLGVTSFLRGVFTYVRLVVMPAGLYFDRSAPLFTTLAAPGVWLTWAVYAAGAAAAWSARRRVDPLLLFCAGWFVIELFPVSQILTSIGVQGGRISLAEHFLYVALIPACVMIAFTGAQAVPWMAARAGLASRVCRIAAGAVVLFMVMTSLQQSFYASNEAAMLKQSLAADVHNARVHAALAMLYVRAADYSKAEAHFRAAVLLDPAEVRYAISLGKSLEDQGRYEAALAVYAFVKEPGSWKMLLEENIASARRQLKK